MALANRPFNHVGGWRLPLQPVVRLPAASPFLLRCQHFPGCRVQTIKGHSIILRATVLWPSPFGSGRHPGCWQIAQCRARAPEMPFPLSFPGLRGFRAQQGCLRKAPLPRVCCFAPRSRLEFGACLCWNREGCSAPSGPLRSGIGLQ